MSAFGKVSVIIPTFNRSGLLRFAIQSVLSQSYTDLEVIVLDDASTDDTPHVVAAFNDPRIVYLRSEVRGGRPSITRNRALRVFSGEWVAFLDDDDHWLPEKLATQLGKTVGHNLLLSTTNAYVTTTIPAATMGVLYSAGERRIAIEDLCKSNAVMQSSVLLHHSIIRKVGLINESADIATSDDYLYWMMCATEGDFLYVDEPLIVYFDHPDTSLRSSNPHQRQILNAKKRFMQWCADRGVNLSFKSRYNFYRRYAKDWLKLQFRS